MKYLFLSLILLFNQDIVNAQGWQIGVRSGVERQYSEYPRITLLLWNTEVFARKEKKKWAMDFALSHSKYSEAISSYLESEIGPAFYSVQNSTSNEYSLTFTCQRKILHILSKKDKIRNYIGLSTGIQYNNLSYSRSSFYSNNKQTAEYKGIDESWNPYIGIAYTFSPSLTKNLSMNATVRPEIVFDRYFGQMMNYTKANAIVGLSCKL